MLTDCLLLASAAVHIKVSSDSKTMTHSGASIQAARLRTDLLLIETRFIHEDARRAVHGNFDVSGSLPPAVGYNAAAAAAAVGRSVDVAVSSSAGGVSFLAS